MKDRWTVLAVAATVVMLVGLLAPRNFVPPGERLSPSVPHQDKIIHLGLFAAFGYFWSRAGNPPRLSGRRGLIVLAASLALAIGTELAQGLNVIHRDPDLFDVLADLAGAVLGVAAVASRGRA